jgi:alpha-N-arabinofuranosidase
VGTREAGDQKFTVMRGKRQDVKTQGKSFSFPWKRTTSLQAEIEVDAREETGRISPRIYGHFIEHLQRCIYDGIWAEDGSRLRPDTLELIGNLAPTVIRYPGGNFASGYHWEDGVGPKNQRPKRFDAAWQAWESNQVGTDEYVALCRQLGSEAFLVTNAGDGTPVEAARWVSYCNDPKDVREGLRRARNGHPSPYKVKLWGIGNALWDPRQIGHTNAASYSRRLLEFISTMQRVDRELEYVAVGNAVSSDALDDPGGLWNSTVLKSAGKYINFLSFHSYQPDSTGWREFYDPVELHHAVCAAPLDIEVTIQRMVRQIGLLCAGNRVKVALDEWNLVLPGAAGSRSVHDVVYTQRDALYIAGVFNVFHRNCNEIGLANLAQLVNVLPLVSTSADRAIPTAIYFPFWIYRQMEKFAVPSWVKVDSFDSSGLGETISARSGVPYLDVTVTRNQNHDRYVIALINRSPDRLMDAQLTLRHEKRLIPTQAWVMASDSIEAFNSFEAPERVRVCKDDLPGVRGETYSRRLPPASLTVWELKPSRDIQLF